jgi:hypothetical protein
VTESADFGDFRDLHGEIVFVGHQANGFAAALFAVAG